MLALLETTLLYSQCSTQVDENFFAQEKVVPELNLLFDSETLSKIKIQLLPYLERVSSMHHKIA